MKQQDVDSVINQVCSSIKNAKGVAMLTSQQLAAARTIERAGRELINLSNMIREDNERRRKV